MRSGRSGFNRYFVNIGMIDGVTRGDLLHFLADVSAIDRKSFGEVSMQKNCAFFEVDNKHDQGLSEKFAGIEVEGRSIRVNREDEGPDSQRGSKHRGSSSYKKKDNGSYRGGGGRRESRNQRGRRR